MRPLPENLPTAPADPGLKAGWVRQIRTYELITPLFGGGVEPQHYDPISVVRATEVRGQLRFWWRATRGGVSEARLQERTWDDAALLTDMRAREAAIWGLASKPNAPTPSQVQVEIVPLTQPTPFVVRDGKGRPQIDNRGRQVHIGAPGSPYGYAGFPLYQAKPKQEAYDGVRFSLTLTYEECWHDDLDAALWAWETFGGIGGRTRRGFGAIRLQTVEHNGQLRTVNHLPGDALQVEQLLKQRLTQYHGRWPTGVPYLSAERLRVLGKQAESSLAIWEQLLSALKRFRHQRPKDRGRNRWPEPDAIRMLSKRRREKFDDGPEEWIYDPVIACFPRAAFGLPIQYQFKQDDQDRGDPLGTNRLLGRDADGEVLDRLGSPLILRPVPCEGGTLGLATILQGIELPPTLVVELMVPDDERADEVKKDEQPVRGVLTHDEAARLRTPSHDRLLPRDPQGRTRTDILNIFLEWL